MNFDKCQETYIKFLLQLKRDSPGREILKELQKTSLCDQHYNMEEPRKIIKEEVNNFDEDKERFDRILKFKGDERDKEIVDYIVHNEFSTLRRKLTSALTIKNYLWYNIELQWDNLLWYFGTGASALGSYSYYYCVKRKRPFKEKCPL